MVEASFWIRVNEAHISISVVDDDDRFDSKFIENEVQLTIVPKNRVRITIDGNGVNLLLLSK